MTDHDAVPVWRPHPFTPDQINVGSAYCAFEYRNDRAGYPVVQKCLRSAADHDRLPLDPDGPDDPPAASEVRPFALDTGPAHGPELCELRAGQPLAPGIAQNNRCIVFANSWVSGIDPYGEATGPRVAVCEMHIAAQVMRNAGLEV